MFVDTPENRITIIYNYLFRLRKFGKSNVNCLSSENDETLDTLSRYLAKYKYDNVKQDIEKEKWSIMVPEFDCRFCKLVKNLIEKNGGIINESITLEEWGSETVYTNGTTIIIVPKDVKVTFTFPYVKKDYTDVSTEIFRKDENTGNSYSFYIDGYNNTKALFPRNIDTDINVNLPSMKNNVQSSSWIGDELLILKSIFYLQERHPETCSPDIFGFKNNNLINNDELTFGYNDYRIVFVIAENKIYYPDLFMENLRSCIDRGTVNIFILITLKTLTGFHANFLILNTQDHTLELFEPNGPAGIDKNKTDIMIEKIKDDVNNQFHCSTKIGSTEPIITEVILPLTFCPQLVDDREIEKRKKDDSTGFCAAWSIWYGDLRLSNPDVNRDEIVLDSIDAIYNDTGSLRDYIRNYSSFLTDQDTGFMREIEIILRKLIVSGKKETVIQNILHGIQHNKSNEIISTVIIYNNSRLFLWIITIMGVLANSSFMNVAAVYGSINILNVGLHLSKYKFGSQNILPSSNLMLSLASDYYKNKKSVDWWAGVMDDIKMA